MLNGITTPKSRRLGLIITAVVLALGLTTGTSFANGVRFAHIEVIKDVEPDWAEGLFNLQIDGITKRSDAGDGQTTGKIEVSAGIEADPGAIHTVGETAGTDTSLAAYFSSISCVDRGLETFNGGPPLTLRGVGPLAVPVDPYDDIVCTITNTKVIGDVATRTLGFWKTHGSDMEPYYGYTCHVFEAHLGGTMDLGWKTVESCEDLFGIFWAAPARETDGGKRDKVCMTQLHGSLQLMAALLNAALDNGAPLDPALVQAMRTALASGNQHDILTYAGQLDAYNQSFDDVAIVDTDGMAIWPADPNGTRDHANLAAGDCN